MTQLLRGAAPVLALAAFLLCQFVQWQPDAAVRAAVAIVLAALILWITEAAPLGVTGLAIPVLATFSGIITWKEAVSVWGDPTVMLFLGAFLLARALDKHGVLDALIAGASARFRAITHPAGVSSAILLASGAVSTTQNNTAVTAMFLPLTTRLARATLAPAMPLLALAYGATFGGMATPVGTAPNFQGYAAIKELEPAFGFLTWMKVGLPVWLGCSLIGWIILLAGSRFLRRPAAAAAGMKTTGTLAVASTPAPSSADHAQARAARRLAIAGFVVAAALWLASGAVHSAAPAAAFTAMLDRHLPDALIPIAVAIVLFVVPVGPQRRTVLDRADFQAVDWDTIFLIAGGLCLGSLLDRSGAALALAHSVAALDVPKFGVMLGLALVTVLLSELTSNTATAALMIPIARAIAPTAGLAPVQTILLVALSASLGFALPVSTPPNALVYGTRLVPLRQMFALGIVTDVLCTVYVVACVLLIA